MDQDWPKPQAILRPESRAIHGRRTDPKNWQNHSLWITERQDYPDSPQARTPGYQQDQRNATPKVLVPCHELSHWHRYEYLLWLPDSDKHTAYRTSQNDEFARDTLVNHWNLFLWTIPKQRVCTGHNRPILKIPRGRVCLLNSHQASMTEDEKIFVSQGV